MFFENKMFVIGGKMYHHDVLYYTITQFFVRKNHTSNAGMQQTIRSSLKKLNV